MIVLNAFHTGAKDVAVPIGGLVAQGESKMWRSFFMALGFAAVILGGELLAIDKATLTIPSEQPPPQQQLAFLNSLHTNIHETFHTKDFIPPEWAPWTLLSVGAVVVLYSCTVSKD